MKTRNPLRAVVVSLCMLASVACSPAAQLKRSCFVLKEVGGPVVAERGGEPCKHREPPASTFKVPHALIALQTGARNGPSDLEPWDGARSSRPEADRDHTLDSAMKASVVWYFQRTATRIGLDRMRAEVHAIGYGNEEVGGDLTHFWLQGPLAISPEEQVDFFDRLARRDLPLRADVMDAVDAMILQEPGVIRRGTPVDVDVTWDPSTRIYAKTGSMDLPDHQVRWLVGHVDAKDTRYAFASLVTAQDGLGTDAVTRAMHGLREAGLVRPKAR